MITGNMLSAMDVSITTMMDAFEGLNRIGLLPMPFPYAQITKWCIVLYVYVSPLGFVSTLQVRVFCVRTVAFCANPAHTLTRSPSYMFMS